MGLCPLKFAIKPSGERGNPNWGCEEKNCEWWVQTVECCAIYAIAVHNKKEVE